MDTLVQKFFSQPPISVVVIGTSKPPIVKYNPPDEFWAGGPICDWTVDIEFDPSGSLMIDGQQQSNMANMFSKAHAIYRRDEKRWHVCAWAL